MIDVEIEDPAWPEALPGIEARARAAAQAALAAPPRRAPDPSAFGGEPAITILLTDDATVRELNARFRGIDAATNVLSFPAAPNPVGQLGDLALAFGVCAREAEQQGKSLADHLQHLVAHGVLHLLGYDHMSDDEAERMEGLERVVLAGLGVSDPYLAGERDHD